MVIGRCMWPLGPPTACVRHVNRPERALLNDHPPTVARCRDDSPETATDGPSRQGGGGDDARRADAAADGEGGRGATNLGMLLYTGSRCAAIPGLWKNL